jgi:thiol-disulfide isomerase/thioredoxin
MQFLNHYSAPMLAALLLAGGISLVIRCGAQRRHWLILGAALAALGAVWLMVRPVAQLATPLSGQPLLLEVQSPYCLGCIKVKPLVDRLESELRGRLVVRRVDIQSAEGRRLASQYGIDLTPTFIFCDAASREQWRSIGELDSARVRNSL